jgi:hypothetical protein
VESLWVFWDRLRTGLSLGIVLLNCPLETADRPKTPLRGEGGPAFRGTGPQPSEYDSPTATGEGNLCSQTSIDCWAEIPAVAPCDDAKVTEGMRGLARSPAA